MTQKFDEAIQALSRQSDVVTSPFEEAILRLGGTMPEEESYGTDFTRGVKRGWQQTKALGAAGTGAALKVIGADDLGESWMDDYRQMQMEIDVRPGAKVRRVEDIDGIDTFLSWAANALGENVTTLAAVLASGGIGGVIGAVAKKKGQDVALGELQRAALNATGKYGYTVGAGSAATLLGTGEVFGEQDEEGIERPGIAVAAGLVMGALDAFGATKIAQAIGVKEGFRKEFLSTLAGMPKAKKVALMTGIGAGTEAATETMQEVVALAARRYVDENFDVLGEEAASRLLNAAAAGGLVGGTVAGVGSTIRGPQGEPIPDTTLQDLLRKQPADEIKPRRREEQKLLTGSRYGRDERPRPAQLLLTYQPAEPVQGDASWYLTENEGNRRVERVVERFGLPGAPAVPPGQELVPAPSKALVPLDTLDLEWKAAVDTGIEIERGVQEPELTPGGDFVFDQEAMTFASQSATMEVRRTGKSFVSVTKGPEGEKKMRHRSLSAVEKRVRALGLERVGPGRSEPQVPRETKVEAQEREMRAAAEVRGTIELPDARPDAPIRLRDERSPAPSLLETRLLQIEEAFKKEDFPTLNRVLGDDWQQGWAGSTSEQWKEFAIRAAYRASGQRPPAPISVEEAAAPVVESAQEEGRVVEWNTGRLYGNAGQPMRARVEGEDIAFIDDARTIIGTVKGAGQEGLTDVEIRRLVMDAYDNGTYEPGFRFERREAEVEPEVDDEVVSMDDVNAQMERDIREALESEKDAFGDPDDFYRRAFSGGLRVNEALGAVEDFRKRFPRVEVVPYQVVDGRPTTVDGSILDLNGRAPAVAGFYSRSERRAYVNLSAHQSVRELERTLVHEGIVHGGFWQLLSDGEKRAVLRLVSSKIDVEKTAEALGVDTGQRGWRDVVAEEYLAYTAERGLKWWDRIFAAVVRAVRRVWPKVPVTNSELRLMVEDWARVFRGRELNQRPAGLFIQQPPEKGEELLYPTYSPIGTLRAFQRERNGEVPLYVQMGKVLDLQSERGQEAARAGRRGYSAMVGLDANIYVASGASIRDPWSGVRLDDLHQVPPGSLSPFSQNIDVLFREVDEVSAVGGRIRKRGDLSEKGEQAIRDIEGLMKLWKMKAAKIFLTPQQIAQTSNVSQVKEYLGFVEDWWRDKMSTISGADEIMQEWRSLGKGGAQRVSEMLFRADIDSSERGRRLTAGEEARLFQNIGMTTDDIRVYRRVRRSFDDVLDTLEKGIIESYVKETKRGEYTKEELASVLGMEGDSDALAAQMTPLFGEADAVALATRVAQARIDMEMLRHRNYFPHTRFGQYTLTLHAKRDMRFENKEYKRDELVIFETAESAVEQQQRLKELRAELGDQFDYTIGKLQDKEFAFLGMPPSLITVLETELQLKPEQVQTLRELLFKYSAGQKFLRSLTKRRGVKGYSKDAMRVYASYMTTAASHLARVNHNQDLSRTLDELQKVARGQDPVTGVTLADEQDLVSMSELHSYFQEHYDYIMNPGNDWAKIRALGFMWYLGANVKSAFVNLTQVPTVTYPWLASRYGDAQAVGAITKAMKDVARGIREGGSLTDDEIQALERGKLAGYIDESLATTLPGIAEGSTLQRAMPGESGSQILNSVNYYGAFFFHKAEQYNRRAAFLAAYRLARRQGNALGLPRSEVEETAYLEGKASVQSTMFEYAKWNRAAPMRGRKSVIFLFQQYAQQAAFLAFGGHGGGAAVRYWLMLGAVAGLQGLPFADNLMDIIDILWAKAGGRGDIRTEVRAYVNDVASWVDTDLAMHGLGRKYGLGPLHALEAIGVPVPHTDISGSLGMGGIIPGVDAGSRVGLDPDAKLGKLMVEIGGPIAGIGYQFYRAATDQHPDTWKRLERLAPTFARNASQGVRWLVQGEERLRTGATLQSFEDTESRAMAIAKMFGFAPTEINKEYERRGAMGEATRYWAVRRRLAYDNLWYARTLRDREGIADARRAIREFNSDVPFAAMRITRDDVEKSMKGRMTRKRLGERELSYRKDERALYRHIGSLYE